MLLMMNGITMMKVNGIKQTTFAKILFQLLKKNLRHIFLMRYYQYRLRIPHFSSSYHTRYCCEINTFYFLFCDSVCLCHEKEYHKLSNTHPNKLQGMIWSLCGSVCFTTAMSCAKLLDPSVKGAVLVFLRCLFGLIFFLPFSPQKTILF